MAAKRDASAAQSIAPIRERLQGIGPQKFVALVESTDLISHTLHVR